MTVDVDMLLAEPPEPDAVVRFKVQFEGSPKTYNYAAVKVGALWVVTGADSQARSWEDMLTWLDRRGGEIVSMENATTWEKL